MKKQIVKIGMIVLAVTFLNVDANAQKKKKKNKKSKMEETTTAPLELKTEIDKVSYAIGLNMIESIKRDFSEANFEAFIAGATAGSINDTNALIKKEEIEGIIAPYFQKKQAEAQAEQMKGSEAAKAEGEKFLAENKTKEGVVTTASGLQYIVLKEGTGAQPTATSNVTVHYHGTTPAGEVFDSSVDRNKPATFGLNQVIKGWTEGVALMKEGAKYKFFIPQELAYGANPRPGSPIKPFMPLVFEVELIKINN
ncbi:MAG: FKBP-type peptidyl-prolyl cis-trans isomerase [Vicingaceae bacterium]